MLVNRPEYDESKKISHSIEPLPLEPSLIPEATYINFDDIIINNGANSTVIAANRYPGVSFYDPYQYTDTYLTHANRYSYPNSLFVGYLCDSSTGQICGHNVMVIDFAQNSKDVSFLWGRDFSYGNGTIEIFEGNDFHLVATVPIGLPGLWTSISLSPYSQAIRRIRLTHPGPFPNTGGFIYIDNFQFTPITTQSPIGYLDSVSTTQGAAVGWSVDPDNTSASSLVDCYVDIVTPNNFIGRVLANNPSPDLSQYPGNHRFSMPVPTRYRDGNQHQMFCYGLDVTGGDSPTLLTGSPKPFRFNLPIGNLDSVVSLNEDVTNLISDGDAVGWSIDTDAPARPNVVHFYIDGPAGSGNFVAETIADIPRPDVNQQTGHPGNHGFSFSIPDQYRNDVQHTIYAYGIDLTGDQPKLLTGSPKTFQLPPRILSVVYEPIDSPLDGNPNSGDGLRIFPDKQSPDETTNRKRVRVKATILPVRNNVRVYFKNFDLDDPSTDAAPVDSNGVQGNDNRGGRDSQGNWTQDSAGIFDLTGSCISDQNGISCLTDANGTATIEFSPTMQPGDNFAVAASLNAGYLSGIIVNGIGLTDSTSGPISQTTYVPPARAKRTEMLTVWRKLHIEVDTMENVGSGNNITGTVTAVGQTACPRPPTSCVINTGFFVNTTQALEMQRFNNGRINVNGTGFSVLTNDGTSVTLNGNPQGSTTVPLGSTFTLYDDDDYNADDAANLNGDDGEAIIRLSNSFIHLSDGATVPGDNSYGIAYIMPEYQWAGPYNQANIVFDLNVHANNTNLDELTAALTVNRNSKDDERDDFWVAYFLVGYQGNENEDADGCRINPQNQQCLRDQYNIVILEGANSGISKGLIGSFSSCDCYLSPACPITNPPSGGNPICSQLPTGSFGSLLYQEAQQDVKRSWLLVGQNVDEIGTTAPHELGHQFGLLGDQIRTTLGIMDYSMLPATNGQFIHPEHINIIRRRIKSPGQ